MKRRIARRLFHVSGLFLYPLSQAGGPFFWWGLLFGVSVLEFLRLSGRFSRFFDYFQPLMRPEEKRRPSGTFWYIWGVGLSFLLLPERAAFSGLLVLALADGLAGLFERGRLHSLVFFGVSLGVAHFLKGTFSWELILKAGLWTLVEGLPRANDNFTLPLAVGLTWEL
ncbi:hypothetical protein FVE67_00870 [Thermosulfurimonas marina]|uniref:Phosphatidate cytidylyltransferase n=1 Tax=Thermosulfurimonas marina TaxID=2047767 RepID=A0A6H1WQL0_9BACT|nr:hypothetical protein FVE67_00870 [Thermosulfurimonas marina]